MQPVKCKVYEHTVGIWSQVHLAHLELKNALTFDVRKKYSGFCFLILR